MRALPRPVVALVACAVLSSGLLSGCGSDDDPGATPSSEAPATDTPTSSAPSTSTPATPTQTPTQTPTETASESPTTAPSAVPLRARLLPTDDVPGLNASWHWQNGKTGTGTKPFGICAKASLIDIGATKVVQRSYFPPDDSDDNAGQQVAEFPDAKTAGLAMSVLRSWRKDCGTPMTSSHQLKAGPLTRVPTTAGDAFWYLITWTSGDEEVGRFEAIGLVRNGTRISVLTMTNSGLDYNYPAGEEPMVAMAQVAAAKLA